MKALYFLVGMCLFTFPVTQTQAQAWSKLISTNFRVFYLETGPHAVSLTDTNSNFLPDYPENMITYFENAYTYFITQLGYAKPPYDTGGRYNIYVVNFSLIPAPANVLGRTNAHDSLGDNSNTAATEFYSYSSYAFMRHHYNIPSSSFTEDGLLRITAAHEFFHFIQNGYNQKLSSFVKESQAVLMADKACHSDFGDAQGNLFLTVPDLALNFDRSDDSTTSHPYGTWMFWKFLEEHADTLIEKHFLENNLGSTTKGAEMSSLGALVAGQGKSLSTLYTNFCIGNFLLTDDAIHYPNYTYKDASSYKTNGLGGVTFEAAFTYTGTILLHKSTNANSRLMHLSTDNFGLTSTLPFSLKFRPALPGADMEMILLRRRASDQVVEVNFPSSRMLNGVREYWYNEEHPTLYDRFAFIIKRYDRLLADTGSIQYELEIGPPDPWTVYDISPYSVGGFSIAQDIDIDPANGDVWVTNGAILKFDGIWHTIRDPFPFGSSWHGWGRLNGRDWFGYDNVGFSRYDGAFTDYGPSYHGNITTFTNEMVSDGSSLWKSGDKVVRFDGFTAVQWGTSDGLPTNSTSDIVVGPGFNVWVGSDKGVGRMAAGTWFWYDQAAGLPEDVVWSIDVSPGGVTWVGMANGKIAKFDGISGFTELKDSLLTPGCSQLCHIYDIKAVANDRIWIGTPNFGAHYYDGSVWRQFDAVTTGIPEMIRVSKIALEGDSAVWFAMQSKIARFSYKQYLAHLNVPIVAAAHAPNIVYPNPAFTTLNFSRIRHAELATVFDMSGKAVQSAPVTTSGMNISNLAAGYYLVRVSDRNGESWYSRFIKL